LHEFPFLTKVVTCAAITFFADIVAQLLSNFLNPSQPAQHPKQHHQHFHHHQSHLRPQHKSTSLSSSSSSPTPATSRSSAPKRLSILSLDPRRVAKYTAYGLCVNGPFLFLWYTAMARFGSGIDGVHGALLKSCIEQLVLEPICIVNYMLYNTVLTITHAKFTQARLRSHSRQVYAGTPALAAVALVRVRRATGNESVLQARRGTVPHAVSAQCVVLAARKL